MNSIRKTRPILSVAMRIVLLVALISLELSAQSVAGGNQSTATKSADATAANTVKIFPAADVRVAFEKGSPLLTKDNRNYWLLAGRRDKPGQAELHEKDLDIFYVLQGSATFITGGKMVDGKTTAPGEVRGASIEGGEVHTLSKDDVVIIPPGVPHWFKDVQGVFLYYVVKVQQP